MKTCIIMLLSLAMMAAVTSGRPTEPDVTSTTQDFQLSDPHEPLLLEQEVTVTETQERVRRSPQNDKDKSRGSVSGGVHREPGVGTVVQAQGQGNIWTSKDGNGRVDAHGQWSKVVDGPGRGKPNYNAGIRYEHRF